MMKNPLLRATAMNGEIRAFVVDTTELVEYIRRRHGTLPTATAAIGRTITAGAIMGAMLKGNQRLTIQVKGNGPLGQIVVDANAAGEVRGYVENPKVHLPSNDIGKLDVSAAVGKEGFIYIAKDIGLKEPYRGSTPIVSGELAEDFTYYFTKSEQTPSAVALGVYLQEPKIDSSVQAAGGLVVQVLPGASEETISKLEEKIATFPAITSLLVEGVSLEGILNLVLDDVQVLEQIDVKFVCKCSRERIESVLISLGKDELILMIEEDGQAEVVCPFCNEAYHYTAQDLQDLINQI